MKIELNKPIFINYIKMNSIDDEWLEFLQNPDKPLAVKEDDPDIMDESKVEPECNSLNISTNTKVLYLNQEIDIYNVYWKLDVIPYLVHQEGIIKKQIKIVNHSEEEYIEYAKHLENIPYYTEVIIKQVNNPNARKVKYKDERKLTVGLSKKDIITSRIKVKNAFYNCFALTVRIFKDYYREMHVKVFNTGKIELPGILNDELLEEVKKRIVLFIQPHLPAPIEFLQKGDNTVLINSNFNCNFYIKREGLHNILKGEKYNIETSYDPCSYPGVKCKYYYNMSLPMDKQTGTVSREDRNMTITELNINKKYTEVSFMIFRTGSCLIVGNCTEEILRCVYAFITEMLINEYANIYSQFIPLVVKEPKRISKKKKYLVDYDYYNDTIRSNVVK